MSGWIQASLGDLTELVTKGTTPSEKDGGFSDFGVNYIKSDAISYEGKVDKSKFVYISQDVHEKFKRSQLKADDILFSMAGAFLGKTGMVAADMLPANTNQAVAIIRVDKKKAEPKFIHFFLRQNSIVDFVNNMSGQSAQPNINFQEIRSISLDLPGLDEQKSIASVLSNLDDKIDLLHRQNKTLEAIAETLFRQWFVEGAGDWKSGSLADVAVNVKDAVATSNIAADSNYIGLEHIDRRNIALNQNGFGSDVSSNKYAFAKNDILFGKLRPYFHKVCFAPFHGICSTDILVIRPKKAELFAFCLFAFFQNDVVEYANLGSGGTRMPRTDWATLKTYPIMIPDSRTIKAFNEIAVPAVAKISSNIQQIKSLEKLRDGLLPKLMSGEVRVA